MPRASRKLSSVWARPVRWRLEILPRLAVRLRRCGAPKKVDSDATSRPELNPSGPCCENRNRQRKPRLGIHRVEELAVVLGIAQLVEQKVDRVHRSHRIEDAAQHVHLFELIWRH